MTDISETHAVTGAFGYSGKYIAKRLLQSGQRVITLTNSSHLENPTQLAQTLRANGPSHSILRPTVLFGREDILINNIARMLRRFPVFRVFRNGGYRLQPIYVDDLAGLAVEHGARRDNALIDAIGPETFTYRQLVTEIGRLIGKPGPVVGVPPAVGYYVGAIVGKIVGDGIVTLEEIEGLMRGLLYVESPPAGGTRLTGWVAETKSSLGMYYASELARRAR